MTEPGPQGGGEPGLELGPGLEEALRTGKATATQLAQLATRVAELEARPGAEPDGAAFASNYTVNQAGEVTVIQNEETVIDELLAEPGDLVVGGKFKKGKTLKAGKKGQILTVNAEGELEWVEGPVVKHRETGLFEPVARKILGGSIAKVENAEETEEGTYYKITFGSPFAGIYVPSMLGQVILSGEEFSAVRLGFGVLSATYIQLFIPAEPAIPKLVGFEAVEV